MQWASSLRPSAPEFPHDNPLLDRGALWDAAALCLAEPPEPLTDTPAAAPAELEDAPPTADPIAAFVSAVAEVTLAHGPAEAASQIQSLLHFGTLDADGLSATAQAALFEGRILETTERGVRPTEWFASARVAWQSILRGESGDLSACGDSTLDAWAADVVARLIANPDKAQTIRRDLRRRGIAAFGMLS